MPEEQPLKPAEQPAPTTPPPDSGAAADTPAETPAAAGDAPKSPTVPADPLPDGTKPTVLTTGSGQPHGEVKTGRASLKSIYQRADIMTTLFTFAGLIVGAVLILGGYIYFTKTNLQPTSKPKLTELSKSELEQLGTFFAGNSAGAAGEILTISSPTLFKQRLGVDNDLKVTGGIQVSGPTALSDLTVDKTTTLGVTNIRGQLTVAGPASFQSPATFSAGTSINGNLSVSGNGTFGGSLGAGVLNVRDISVSGTLNIAGHLAITGQNPTAAPEAGAGSGAHANVDGNDSAGTVTISTGSGAGNGANTGGQLVTIKFRAPYARVPHVVITPVGAGAGALTYYIQKTADGFTIGVATNPSSNATYSFDYWVVQ